MSQTIIQYILDNQKAGYSLNSIKSGLLSSGVSLQEINASIDYILAQQKYAKPAYSANPILQSVAEHKNVLLYILIAIGALLIITAIALVMSSNNDPEIVTPNPITTTNPPIVPATSEPEVIYTPPVPKTEPVKNTDPVPPKIEADQKPPQIITTPTTLSRFEINTQVRNLSTDDPQGAIGWCNKITTTVGRQECFESVALESGFHKYCELINETAPRDTCYVNFAHKELSTMEVCQKITSEFKKRSCVQLFKNFSDLEKAKNPDLTTPPPVLVTEEIDDQPYDSPSYSS